MPIDRERLKTLVIPYDSTFYEDCSPADHWFLMARAFQQCCIHLLAEMIEQKINGSFHHAKVALSLFEQAVELFLKSGIIQAGKKLPTAGHPLDELYKQFKKLYPGNQFEFTGRVDDFVRRSERFPHSQYARYPTDRSGRLWEAQDHSFIDVARYYEQTSLFLEDFNRLWPLMKTRYPIAPKESGALK
jgi:HEPN domain-containing protein